jgi:undecaprenyl-diphosphatase
VIARAARVGALTTIGAVAYVLLGRAVAGSPPHALWPIDAAAAPLAGHATHLALVFTASCWWPVLVAFGIAAGVLAWRAPSWRARALFSIVVTLVGWQTSDVLKNLFARSRPSYWFLHHETSFSYSSGHAMFAVVVYGLWAYFFATSTLPRTVRIALATLLSLWGCGVIWSRLALGAHWPTDLIGGVLLGISVLAFGAAILTSGIAAFAGGGAPVSFRAGSRSEPSSRNSATPEDGGAKRA